MSQRSIFLGFLACVAVCLGTACGGDDSPTGEPTLSICPTGSTLTYETFGSAFMTEYCVGCHSITKTGDARLGAPDDHNYDTLQGIQDVGGPEIDERAAAGPAAINRIMPPVGLGPIPTEAERYLLGEWIACGMPP